METIQKFQDLLRSLFQFEPSDLDFGIYRILNYKREQIASLFEEGAVFISWPAAGTVRNSDSFASYIMFESKVSAAYPAVHSARSD